MLWTHGLGLNPLTDDNKPGVAICRSVAIVPWSGGRRITGACWWLLANHEVQWRSCLDGTRWGMIEQDPLLSPVSVLVNIAAHINHIPILHVHTCKTSQIIPSKWIHLDFIDRHALTKLDELWYLNLFHLCVCKCTWQACVGTSVTVHTWGSKDRHFVGLVLSFPFMWVLGIRLACQALVHPEPSHRPETSLIHTGKMAHCAKENLSWISVIHRSEGQNWFLQLPSDPLHVYCSTPVLTHRYTHTK